jgi:hypothetical protein
LLPEAAATLEAIRQAASTQHATAKATAPAEAATVTATTTTAAATSAATLLVIPEHATRPANLGAPVKQTG